MDKAYQYNLSLSWNGNRGKGTINYQSYERDFSISIAGKTEIHGSSDPAFRGDASKYNPEELLLASLASCHMLWFLHLCAQNGVIVTAYTDQPSGTLMVDEEGGGKFKEVILNPMVTLADKTKIESLNALHVRANELCFIANSVNFPVTHFSKAKTD